MHDERKIMRRLKELEAKENNMGLSKVSYGEICDEPINPCIPMSTYPEKFDMPKIDKFKSKEDLKEHLKHFKHACYFIGNDNVILLNFFPMNLKGKPMNDYNSLLQHSLYSFEQLANLFLEHFSINIKKRASITDFMKMARFDQESIFDYVAR